MPLKAKCGDTIIEVLFAIAVFSFLVIITITLMNNTVANSQGNLEATMARSFLNEQAEVIRFAHDAKIGQLDSNSTEYTRLWDKIITGHIVTYDQVTVISDVKSCSEIKVPDQAFVINTRTIHKDPVNSVIEKGKIKNDDTLYPRIIYGSGSNEEDDAAVFLDNIHTTNPTVVEGFWVYAVQGTGYYDFYLQACWNEPGRATPTTLDTVIRLHTR